MPEHVLTPGIEIITDSVRRRRWSSAEKLRIVEETLDGRESISVVARRNGVAPNLLYRWRRLMLEGGSVAVAGDAGISGSDVRDMMLEAVEKRFGTFRAPAPVEILSDNGAPYTARETRIFARQLGLKPCFTPVQSPQSNGISQAFVNTLKRDYVHVSPLPDAETVLGLIDGWIEDYNENHPHSGLKMRSPREFIAAQTATA
jgi:hypothetical protein